MTECALVVFDKAEQPGSLKKSGRLRSFVRKAAVGLKEFLYKKGAFKTAFGAKLFRWLIRKKQNDANTILEFWEQFRLHILKLPFPHEQLSGLNPEMVEGLIRDNLKRSGIERCYVPAFLKGKGYFSSFDSCPDYGKLLVKVLLGRILNDLYTKGKRRPGDLDIVVTAGEDDGDALTAIRLIESQIRYVTLAVPEKDRVEAKAEELFGDLGLSISVVSDYRSALKNADLVINFSDQRYISHKVKLSPHALVINAAGMEMSKQFPENTIINGIITGLPKNVLLADKEILQYYTKNEIAGLAAAAILEITPDSPYEYGNSHQVAADFETFGFQIEGFMGRHGTVRKDFLKNLANGTS